MDVDDIVTLMIHFRDDPANATLALAAKDAEACTRFLAYVAGL